MRVVLFFASMLLLVSCKSVDLVELLEPHTDLVVHYRGEFYDPEIRSDTLHDEVHLVVSEFLVGDKKAFHYVDLLSLTESDDNESSIPFSGGVSNSDIGEEIETSNHFLGGAFIIKNDSIHVSIPVWGTTTNDLMMEDFVFSIGGTVKPSDTVKFNDGDFDVALTGFNRESIKIDGKKFKRCVYIKHHNYYDEEPSVGHIWIHPKYGVVKWIRGTGRIEEVIQVSRKYVLKYSANQ